jgi:hypothetical protein
MKNKNHKILIINKLFVVIFLFITNLIYGQGIIGGARVGFLISSLHSPKEYNFTTKTGFNGGILLQVASSDLFALQTELCFARQGGIGSKKIFQGSDTLLQTLDLQLDYVEVPIMGKLTIGEKVRLSAYSGFVLGFLTNLREKNTLHQQQGNTLTLLESNSSKIKTFYQDSNISWLIGASAEYNNVFIEFRYSTGLSDISQKPELILRTKSFYFAGGYVLYF